MLEFSIANTFNVSILKKTQSWWILRFSSVPAFTYTWQLPSLADDVRRMLPQILLAECDNPQGLPFKSEMLETETAHFYEHVLLEYLCDERLKEGASEVACEGRTFWNTLESPSALFTIAIDHQTETDTQFFQAVRRSNELLMRIIKNSGANKNFQQAERGVDPLSTVSSGLVL